MVRLFVRHPVSDFGAWKEVYDAFDAERAEMGVVDHAVYQSVENANDVTVWHDFESLEAGQEFADSERLKSVMEEAGVAGPPTVWFTEEAN